MDEIAFYSPAAQKIHRLEFMKSPLKIRFEGFQETVTATGPFPYRLHLHRVGSGMAGIKAMQPLGYGTELLPHLPYLQTRPPFPMESKPSKVLRRDPARIFG